MPALHLLLLHLLIMHLLHLLILHLLHLLILHLPCEVAAIVHVARLHGHHGGPIAGHGLVHGGVGEGRHGLVGILHS